MSELSEQAVRRRRVRANAPKVAFTLPQLEADGPLCRSALYREIREGRLIARKVGRSTLVLADDWHSFLQSLPRVGIEVAATEPVGLREARAKRQAPAA